MAVITHSGVCNMMNKTHVWAAECRGYSDRKQSDGGGRTDRVYTRARGGRHQLFCVFLTNTSTDWRFHANHYGMPSALLGVEEEEAEVEAGGVFPAFCTDWRVWVGWDAFMAPGPVWRRCIIMGCIMCSGFALITRVCKKYSQGYDLEN